MHESNLTVITPTGDRPLPFSLCASFMARQTIKPHRWIIVDDGVAGDAVLPYSFAATCIDAPIVKRKRTSDEPQHTLALNMKLALSRVTTDCVVIMEDDDWYSPRYLETMLALMPGDPMGIVGQDHTYYYRIQDRMWCKASVPSHMRASLCATGFRAGVIPVLDKICDNSIRDNTWFLDLALWHQARTRCFTRDTVCVGIKQLPGRRGLTSGWSTTGHGWEHDYSMHRLTELVGKHDALVYSNTLNKEGTNAKTWERLPI